MAGQHPQTIALRKCRKHELRFHKGECIANALPWSAAKRKVSVAMAAFGSRGIEAGGIEALGIIPEVGVAMCDIRAQDDGRACGERVVAEGVRLLRAACDEPGRRVNAQ